MASIAANPLIATWTTPYGMPPFAEIKVDHFAPAFEQALTEAVADVDAIAASTAAPTFENTITALEKSGALLTRVSSVFWSLAGTDTTPAIQELERELAPKLTAHYMRIYQDQRLFQRVDSIDQAKAGLGLSGEQIQVLERYMRAFVKSGARLNDIDKAKLKAIAERQSTLSTTFGQNVLKDEQSWSLILDGEADIAGLDAGQRAIAKQAAEDKGESGKYTITLSRSSIVPFLEYSTRRDLRETAYKAWTARGFNAGATDNRGVLSEIVSLRAASARLLGFNSFADLSLEHTMARTPAEVLKLLNAVWPHARDAALAERLLLQEAAKEAGDNVQIAAWDWRYYTEKVRKARYNLDEADVKPYLQLDRMIEAAFDCATRLFGLVFVEIKGIALHNPEARAWDVKRKNGRPVGVFVGDYFMRPSKRSGAWMSAFRRQHKLADTADGIQLPIITNTCNFAKPAVGEPALISLEDARTLFHEFGHALHGLLSNVTYPSVSGTSVSRDFVELPSQLYEHWLSQSQVLKMFARHYLTDAPMPDELIARIKAAQTFNQGFATCEFLASAIVDMDLHAIPADAPAVDIEQAERDCLSRIGMPAEIGMRHRPAHFTHITGGYAAGYYSYLWSEVLDADAFRAFEETGDIFDAATARRLHDHIYSAGGKQDPADAYIGFRGKLPGISGLLAKRGFVADPAVT
jgi:peptidyl-dipeptidase Dcp